MIVPVPLGPAVPAGRNFFFTGRETKNKQIDVVKRKCRCGSQLRMIAEALGLGAWHLRKLVAAPNQVRAGFLAIKLW
jgi:hypothetical protein